MKKPLLFLILALMISVAGARAQNHFPENGTAEFYEEAGYEPAEADLQLLQHAISSLREIPPEGLLLMPHSGLKSVMSFDPQTGDLLNSYFFPADEVNLGTPIKLIWNNFGTSMLISDQVKKLVLKYSPEGAYQGIFAPSTGPDDSILNNVRGCLIRPNGNLLVAVSAGANMHSIAEFNHEGEFIGQFIAQGAGGLNGPWDMVYRPDFNDYLVSASGSSGIHRYDANGQFIEMFATGLAFPQQMQLMENGNILVVNFSAPSGLYEYSSTGTLLNYYGVVTSLRGVHSLGNGNFLVTNSSGVHEINRQNQLVSTKVAGQSRWITHIKPLNIGDLHNLQLQVNPAGAGTVTGSGNYPEDYMVNLTATPGFYYHFVNWTLDATEVSNQASFQYQMPGNDVVLVANFAPKPLFTATFSIKENSDQQEAIVGAVITIEGFDALTSDATGQAQIDLPAGTYSATITAQGYVTFSTEFEITNADISVIALLTDVILAPASLNIEVDGQNALFTWESVLEREFRFDDGTAVGQLGSSSGTLNTVLGSVHRNDAVLQEMSWFLTENGGPHATVKVWVFGLSASGQPDPSNVLFSQANVPNVDLQWNTFVFPQPVEAPNGFLIGVSYAGFLGLGRDSGVDSQWLFKPNTHFFCSNVTTGTFAAIETLGDFQNNFLIRAYGIDNGDLSFTYNEPAMANTAGELQGSYLETAILAGGPADNKSSKALIGYYVFLNDMQHPVELVTELEYLFTELPGGTHTAGVRSVYTTGSSEIITIDFVIDAPYSITFDVSDENGAYIDDAIITLNDGTNAAGDYYFPGLTPGTYNWVVSREGYRDASGEAIITDHDITVTVELEEVEYFNVTFRVHMHGYENYDPANDVIYLSGTMIGWVTPGEDSENQLMSPDNDDELILIITKQLAAGTYYYKYFLNAGWGNGEWAGDPNRMVAVESDMIVNNVFGDPDDNPVQVPDIDFDSLKMFPNPAKTILTIQSPHSIQQVRLIDMLGQVVYNGNTDTRQYEMNVAGFKNGIYFVQILTSAGLTTQKIQIIK